MTDDPRVPSRRQGDVVLVRVEGELALLKQGVELGARATELGIANVGKAVDGLTAEVRQIASQLNEPAASAAGRALLAAQAEQQKDLDTHGKAIADLEAFRNEARGAIKAMRGLVVVLGGLSSILAILSFFIALTNGHP